MKLFISYSRKDQAAAALLSYILRNRGIQCYNDYQMQPAQAFDEQLQAMIRKADSVLVLLTNSATTSAWVNQEIGYAVAIGKPIWPLAIEEKIKPKGFISTTQTYSKFDWSDTERTIDLLVETLQHGPTKMPTYKLFGLPQVLQGKVARTQFVTNAFQELQNRQKTKLTIRTQAAFSIFCASDHPLYCEAVGNNKAYMQLLLNEKKYLTELIEQGARLELILWPVRAYEQPYLGVRYKNLLEWMKSTRENDRIQYALGRYAGPNRYIIDGQWCVEGYKLHHTTGYEMSIVHYDQRHIAEALGEFNAVFPHDQNDKEETIVKVEEMYTKAISLDVGNV